MIPSAADLRSARVKLCRLDPLMAKAHAQVKPSTWVVRERGFGGLVRQVVGQQFSVASADSIRRKMLERLGSLSPDAVLAADETQLRSFGLSMPKVRYIRAIAEAAQLGLFERLRSLSDEEAVAALVAIKGVGR